MARVSIEDILKGQSPESIFMAACESLKVEQDRATAKGGTRHETAELDFFTKKAQSCATFTKIQYDQYLQAGFTVEQATQFIIASLNK